MACFPLVFAYFVLKQISLCLCSYVCYNSSDPSCHFALCVHTTSKLH